MTDEKHDCIACPVEVRGLFAAATNAYGAWARRDDPSRVAHKMAELQQAIERIAPIVDQHFDGRNTTTGQRVQGAPVSVEDQRKYGVIR